MNKQDYTLENGELIIKEGVRSIEWCTFEYNKITNLTIPNSVGSIESWAFYVNKITKLIIPNSVKSIGISTFANNQITNLTIPNSVEYIGDWAFENNKIEHVTIPNNINYISNSTFDNNPLKTITFKGVTYNIKIVDGYFFIVESTKIKGSYTIYKGYIFDGIENNELQKEYCYVAQKDNYTAHGKTIKKAIEDVEFKIYYEKIEKEPIYLDTIITDEIYRIITGSCELGIKHWREQNNITKESYTVAGILPILEKTNAYGLSTFKKLIRYE